MSKKLQKSCSEVNSFFYYLCIIKKRKVAMKKIIILLLVIASQSSFAQGNKKVSIFHRLIIYNTDNEIMLVKIKDTDVWVTPGFYQDTIQSIRKGLNDVAATYGMKISSPELKGVFSMRRDIAERKEMLIRNIYTCKYLEGKIHFPEHQPFSIGEIKWLPMKEALQTLTHKSVQIFLKQTHNNPAIISGGAIVVYKESKEWKVKIVEEFYPLFSSTKQKRSKMKN